LSDVSAEPTLDAPDMKNRARRQFDAWAGNYDRSVLNHFLFRPAYMAAMEEIARWHATNPRPFTVLDIGCGTGTLAGVLAGSAWPVTVVGIDYSAAMCLEASGKADRAGASAAARFVAGDSEHLPFADGAFNIVTCSNSFHHYPNQAAVVREMRRVLAPGGWLVLIDGFRDNVIGWVVFDVLINRFEGKVHHAPWLRLHQYFVDAGFVNIRRRKFNFWLPLLATIGQA
jgi:ubiquinone/menaquinone biosynthesis C-methylase UbiE